MANKNKSKRTVESYDLSLEYVIEKLLELRHVNVVDYEIGEDCVYFTIGEINTTPETTIRRADALQHWLQQPGMPSQGSDTWKFLPMIDKLAISQINKAMDQGGTQFSNLMEQAFGRNTEGTDVSGGSEGFEVDFGVGDNTRDNE